MRAVAPALILGLNLPGHGRTAPVAEYGYGGLVGWLNEATDGFGPFVLVGHSVGGAVAWLCAARNPASVSRLVLVEPAAPHQSRFLDRPAPEPRHLYSYGSPQEAVEAMAAIDASVTVDDVRTEYRQRADGRWEPDFDPAIFPALVEDGRAHAAEYRAELGSIRAPTLIVRGSASLLSQEKVEDIAGSVPDSRIATIEGAGHVLNRERPKELASLVREFALG